VIDCYTPVVVATPERGSPRVQSWIYEVLNPLFESLEIELGFLTRRNTTWSFYSRELEYLRPASRYLSLEGRHILRDYAMENPEILERIRAHDDLLARLTKAASHAFDELTTEAFRGLVDDAVIQFLDGASSDHDITADPRYPGGAYRRAQVPDLVAEHVINSVDDLPSRYADRVFWQQHRDRFRALGTGRAFEQLQAVLDKLVELDTEFRDWIVEVSLELCRTYDVPAAPLTRAASE
jgi:hypothetical protein